MGMIFNGKTVSLGRAADTADAGTSEGAKKAAQTRKTGGAKKPHWTQSLPRAQRRPFSKNNPNPALGQGKFTVTRDGDAGTSEGAKKAAQTRKSGGGKKPPPKVRMVSKKEHANNRQRKGDNPLNTFLRNMFR